MAARKKGVAILSCDSRLSFRHRMFALDLKHQGHPVVVVLWERGGAEKPSMSRSESGGITVVTLKTTGGKKDVKEYSALLKQALKSIGSRAEILYLTHLRHLRHFLSNSKGRTTLLYDAGEASLPQVSRKLGPLSGLAHRVLEIFERKLVRMNRVRGVSVSGQRAHCMSGLEGAAKNAALVLTVPARSQRARQEDLTAARKKLGKLKVVAAAGDLKQMEELEYVLDVAGSVVKCYEDVLFMYFGSVCADREALRRMLIERRIDENRTAFVGNMPYGKMMAYLENARVGLTLEDQKLSAEATAEQSIRLFSYMQAGLPVVGPQYCAGGSYARDTGCGMFVDTTSPVEVSSAVAYLLTHPDEARSMGLKGREAFMKRFNWETERQAFSGLIEAASSK